MKTENLFFSSGKWHSSKHSCDPHQVQLVLLFGTTASLESHDHATKLKDIYPHADIVGCSTAGNIQQEEVSEHEAVATAVEFSKGHIKTLSTEATSATLQEKITALARDLPRENLRHVLILADGLRHNGDLIANAVSTLDNFPPLSGGMAADGDRFDHTLLLANSKARRGLLVLMGIYGESVHVKTSSCAGWDEFGPEWIITRSSGNIVHEINHRPALELYEKYLGRYINQLPGSGLLFPMVIKEENDGEERLRVLMAVNDDRSLLYVGSVPEGSYVKLCKTNSDKLVKGAKEAAKAIIPHNDKPSLCLVISCMARRNVLKQLTVAELEKVADVLGKNTHVCGFYSYGELSPDIKKPSACHLHNQTMTLTVIYED